MSGPAGGSVIIRGTRLSLGFFGLPGVDVTFDVLVGGGDIGLFSDDLDPEVIGFGVMVLSALLFVVVEVTPEPTVESLATALPFSSFLRFTTGPSV